MEIKNAYIVNIDFDGDISNKYSGEWLIFTELDEVKEVIREALNDLMQHELNNGIEAGVRVGGIWCPISKILNDDTLLEAFIEYGGIIDGNWKILIGKNSRIVYKGE